MALPAEGRISWEADRGNGRMVRVAEGEIAPVAPKPPPPMVAILCPVCAQRPTLGHAAPVPGAVYETRCRQCKTLVRVAF